MKKFFKITAATLTIIFSVIFVSYSREGRGAETLSSESSFSETTNAVASAESVPQGEAILELLSLLRSVSVDSDFLKSGGFSSLVDYPLVLPPIEIGRENPFAPF